MILDFQFKAVLRCFTGAAALVFFHKLMTVLSSPLRMKSGMKYRCRGIWLQVKIQDLFISLNVDAGRIFLSHTHNTWLYRKHFGLVNQSPCSNRIRPCQLIWICSMIQLIHICRGNRYSALHFSWTVMDFFHWMKQPLLGLCSRITVEGCKGRREIVRCGIFNHHVTWYLPLNRLTPRGVTASCGGRPCIFKERAQTYQWDASCHP